MSDIANKVATMATSAKEAVVGAKDKIAAGVQKAADVRHMQSTAGAGGETHQQTTGTNRMTTDTGCPISDNQNTLRIGVRGPAALEDQLYREKMFHFDHERIPERVVHARGYGVHGYFQNYESLSDITCADLFARANEQTPVFVRFSTAIGNKGSMDLARDVRGFATKFYTKQGNWDLVANNIPVFFIQDAIKFPDFVHAAKPAPDRDFPQAQTAHDNFWDFVGLLPESAHMVMWVMSDRGIPRSFRFMEGFGVHSFRLVNAEGKSTFVKFHWKPLLGLQSVVWNEAVKINGADPDFLRRDLWDNITQGSFPEWELGFQLFDEDYARSFTEKYGFDILDSTKLIPEEEIPVRRVGKLVLNRVCDSFFEETEQVAFCTQNVVPGIDFTEDPLLQGRNFSYLDTQLKRLGSPNFNLLPINAPKCPFMNFHQNGHMSFGRSKKGRVNYEPNSWSETKAEPVGPRETPDGFRSFPVPAQGSKLRARSETFADHYSQARQFYISQTPIEQVHIRDAFVFELSKCERSDIQARYVGHLRNIDEALAQSVFEMLGLSEMPPAAVPQRAPIDLPPSPALSIVQNGPKAFSGRKLGILVSDGADATLLAELKKGFEAALNIVNIVVEKVGGATLSNGSKMAGEFTVEGGPSVLFDAVVVLTAPGGGFNKKTVFRVRDWIADAYSHYKFIAHTPSAIPLMLASGVELDGGCIPVSNAADVASFLQACGNLRFWARESLAEGEKKLSTFEAAQPSSAILKPAQVSGTTVETFSAEVSHPSQMSSADDTVTFHEDVSKGK